MHYPNVHLYTKDWAWKLIIIILPAMYKLWNFQKCNVSHGGIALHANFMIDLAILTLVPENVKISARPLNSIGN